MCCSHKSFVVLGWNYCCPRIAPRFCEQFHAVFLSGKIIRTTLLFASRSAGDTVCVYASVLIGCFNDAYNGGLEEQTADEPLQNEFFVRHRGSPRDRLQKLSVWRGGILRHDLARWFVDYDLPELA